MSDPLGVLDLASLPPDDDEAPRRPPSPVHLWNPPNCGSIDIRIARDGAWFHEGSPIGRQPLVRLFAGVLRKDPDGFHLVTPVEKLRIVVEDAPFLAVALARTAEGLRFRTNVGDEVTADADHPIRVAIDPETGEPAPYVRVRGGLEARLTRPVFYQLVDMAELREGPDGAAELWVESAGCAFPLGAAGTAV